jgi:hypothetical protein
VGHDAAAARIVGRLLRQFLRRIERLRILLEQQRAELLGQPVRSKQRRQWLGRRHRRLRRRFGRWLGFRRVWVR